MHLKRDSNETFRNWNLIQNQPLLKEIFKEPPMKSFRAENLLRIYSSEQNYKGAKTKQQMIHVCSRTGLSPPFSAQIWWEKQLVKFCTDYNARAKNLGFSLQIFSPIFFFESEQNNPDRLLSKLSFRSLGVLLNLILKLVSSPWKHWITTPLKLSY